MLLRDTTKDIVLRVDAFDRPKETAEAQFRFGVRQQVVSIGEKEGEERP